MEKNSIEQIFVYQIVYMLYLEGTWRDFIFIFLLLLLLPRAQYMLCNMHIIPNWILTIN